MKSSRWDKPVTALIFIPAYDRRLDLKLPEVRSNSMFLCPSVPRRTRHPDTRNVPTSSAPARRSPVPFLALSALPIIVSRARIPHVVQNPFAPLNDIPK
jgi:hypothetical protein